MKSYILKSWLSEKTVYISDSLFSSDDELWKDVTTMKGLYPKTYAVVVLRQFMTKKLKILLIQTIVAENFCDLDTFCENVLTTDGKQVFNQKLDACKNRSDVEELVNQYI